MTKGHFTDQDYLVISQKLTKGLEPHKEYFTAQVPSHPPLWKQTLLRRCICVSFKCHSPVFHKTEIYHTHHILAQYHKIVSLQMYLVFQFKDHSVKMDTLEKQHPFLYKNNFYHRKAGDYLQNTHNTSLLKSYTGCQVGFEDLWRQHAEVPQKFPAELQCTIYIQFLPLTLHQARVNTIILPTAKNSSCSPNFLGKWT